MTWNWKTPSLWHRMLVGLLIVGAASAFRVMFFSGLGRGIPYLIYYPATMLAAVYGGLATGFLATGLSAILAFFWVQRGDLSPPEWLGFLVFVVSCTAISFVCEAMHRAHAKAEASNRALQTEMADREQVQEKLRETNEYLENLFNYANAPIIVWDLQFHITRFNHVFETLTGRSAGEVIGKSLEILFPASLVESSMALIKKTTGGERWETVEIPILHLDGSVRVLLWNSATVFAPDGKSPVATIAQGHDITDRKLAEQALRNSETKLRAILDATPFPVALVDVQDNNIVFWSRSALTLFGHTATTAAEWYRLAYPDPEYQRVVIAQWKPAVERARQSGQVVNAGEYRVTCHDGSVRICELYAVFIADNLLVVFNDITDRKRAEEALAASEVRYRRLFETSKDGVLILDAQTGQIVDANPFLVELLGYSHAMFLGKKVWELGALKDLFASHINFELLQQQTYIRYEDLPLVTHDGRRIEVEFISNVYLVNGQKVIQCNIRDVSARKRAEHALRESALELQHKNAELERFLYAASHDLKSPVVTVRTFLGYLEQDMAGADADRIAKDMAFIRAATDKMALLLDDLLEISRVGRVVCPPVSVSFRDLVNDAVGAVAGRIAQRGVMLHVAERDVTLHGDRARLGEIWQNLIDNSCKFMGGQPEPSIEVGVETREAETVFFVRDNGIGIDPRHRAKVFNLFEKLDPKAEGTGIGLALVKRIVELYAGRIWVESEGQGKGACFYFTLPGTAEDNSQTFLLQLMPLFGP